MASTNAANRPTGVSQPKSALNRCYSLHHIDTVHPGDEERYDPPEESRAATPRPSSDHTLRDVENNATSNAEKRAQGSTVNSDLRLRTRSSNVPAEIREWKNDIVTYDSKTDPENPKNWTFKRKCFVTALFGLTTS